MSQVTIKQLKEALDEALKNGQSEDTVIEIAVQSYNKAFPLYIPLMTTGVWDSVITNAPTNGVIRLASSLPYNKEEYTIFTKRKIK